LITWRIDHDQHLVRATGSDAVTMADITRYLAEVAAAGGMPYGKFLDARFTTLELRASDMRSLSEAVKHYAMQGPLGPIAILVDAEMTEFVAELFQQRTADRNRPVGIFRTEGEALGWLAERR
jgi:hypothetical protein